MPVLQEHQPFLVHAALSAPRWHQWAGWTTQWEKRRDCESIYDVLNENEYLFFDRSKQFSITVRSKECVLRPVALKCCSTMFFFFENPMDSVVN